MQQYMQKEERKVTGLDRPATQVSVVLVLLQKW
jgi:hypothetical protein